MNENAHDRFPRLAPILLIGVLIGIAIVRPGNLVGDDLVGYRLCTTLIAMACVGYIAWRFHGILAAGAALVLFRFAELEVPTPDAFSERQADAAWLVTLAIGIAAGSRQGGRGKLPWIVIACMAVGVGIFGWYGIASPTVEDTISNVRIRQIMLMTAVLAAVVGLLSRSATWSDRLRLIGATIGPPALGIGAIRIVHGAWPSIFAGGAWSAIASEWQLAVSSGAWSSGAWAWTAPWFAGILVLIGLWRTLARGIKERKLGRPPLATLLTAASIGVMVALGARPLAAGSLALAATGALLCVFGIADLIMSLVERIELKPPEPGPAPIPRVK